MDQKPKITIRELYPDLDEKQLAEVEETRLNYPDFGKLAQIGCSVALGTHLKKVSGFVVSITLTKLATGIP